MEVALASVVLTASTVLALCTTLWGTKIAPSLEAVEVEAKGSRSL